MASSSIFLYTNLMLETFFYILATGDAVKFHCLLFDMNYSELMAVRVPEFLWHRFQRLLSSGIYLWSKSDLPITERYVRLVLCTTKLVVSEFLVKVLVCCKILSRYLVGLQRSASHFSVCFIRALPRLTLSAESTCMSLSYSKLPLDT